MTFLDLEPKLRDLIHLLFLFGVSQSVSQSGTQNFRDLVGMLYDRIIISAETSSGRGWSGMAGDGRGWPMVSGVPVGLHARVLKRGALALLDF